MFEKEVEAKNESSNRRRFFRKLVGLAALAGIGGASLAGSTRKVYGADTDPLYIGQANTGSSITTLTASPASYAAFKVETTSASDTSKAIYGYASASTGLTLGVNGISVSEGGIGVYGWVTSSTGTTYGVVGESDSESGISVIGTAGNASSKPLVARGYSGQIANLQEWHNSSSTALSVVDKDGYFGIGTSSPVTALHVKSSSSNPAVRLENENNFVGQFIYCYSNTASHIPFFSGRRARGTIASPTAVQTNDILMRYGGAGYGTSGFPGGNRAILEFRAAETWTDGAQGTYILFSTTPTGSTGALERMRITAEGDIIPPADGSGSIGTASSRWGLIRGVSVQSGDLIFENGVKATEEGDGLAFINKSGEKIATLDHEGNLRVKGKLIEGL